VAYLSNPGHFSSRSGISNGDRKLGDIDGRPLRKAMGKEIVVISADRIIAVDGANFCDSLNYSGSVTLLYAMLESGEPCQGPSLYHISGHCSFPILSRGLIQRL